ncbi:hypothetical protein Ddye_009851 [Dipteronia dyeriana]|uniref:Uncharacterized protein n=1 Tax=Dipteronia dyeriana TaxID=168575 RepID=A0AAE0CMS1_9ROSI|nr:hypothetical protein Ddye_009851 [Dipteronia dyeriana]
MFSFYVGVHDSNSTEVLAIHKAVELCCSSPICFSCRVVFESDSKVAISWINGKGIRSLAHVHFIYDIRCGLKLIDGEVIFKSRSSNQFVDGLAKLGSSRSGDLVEWGMGDGVVV